MATVKLRKWRERKKKETHLKQTTITITMLSQQILDYEKQNGNGNLITSDD